DQPVQAVVRIACRFDRGRARGVLRPTDLSLTGLSVTGRHGSESNAEVRVVCDGACFGGRQAHRRLLPAGSARAGDVRVGSGGNDRGALPQFHGQPDRLAAVVAALGIAIANDNRTYVVRLLWVREADLVVVGRGRTAGRGDEG